MKALRFCLDSCLIFLLHHGWLNLLGVQFVGTCFAMVLQQMILKVVQRLLIGISYAGLSRKHARSSSRSSAIFSVSTFFHKWMRRLTGFCLDATTFMFASIMTMSRSLNPGHGMHLFNKEGRFVKKPSRVMLPQVGNSTTCMLSSNVKNIFNEEHVDLRLIALS